MLDAIDADLPFDFNPGQEKVWTELYTSTAIRFALVYGGSRSGKTFLTIYTIILRALKAPFSKHLIVRQEAAAARAALARGNLATIRIVLRVCFPGLELTWNEKYGYYEFENGSELWIGGLNDDKAMERILGNEYASIYINEASEVKHSAFVLLRSRLAQVVTLKDSDKPLRQVFYVDLNPTNRMHWTYRVWTDGVDPEDGKQIDRRQYGVATINPQDNAANLSPEYLLDLQNMNERAKKRFYEGKYSADDENALWKRSYFKRVYLDENGDFPVRMKRIVIAIDPAISSTDTSNETGIAVVALGADNNGYVLDDVSGVYRPEEWARRASSAFLEFDADRVIGEVNQGGDLVESTIRVANADIPYKAVRATRGKYRRAEPVAALYEKGKIFHVGEFSELEDQMCAITPGFDDKAQGWSPDRVDAVVWGFTELFPSLTRRKSAGSVPVPEFSMV